MTDEVVEVVARWLAALEHGDPAPQMCDPDVEVVNWAESPIPGPYHGHEGVRRWWDDVADAFDDVRFEVVAIEAIDDRRAVAALRLIGTFRLTGIELAAAWGSIISVEDGKIARAVGYPSPSEARAAAGLGPRATS